MKNLRHYPNPPIEVYLSALDGKEDEDMVRRLVRFEGSIRDSYDSYHQCFLDNNLQTINANEVFDPVADDLQGLYAYQTEAIKAVKKKIKEEQVFKITSTCQNCTINSVNSLDHILGQTKFPEFAVNPLNLFPTCTECNSYKGKFFMKGTHRKFLNLYLDNLPPQQYLFADVTGTPDNMDFSFSVRNTNGIDPDLFQIIKNHYDFLHLCGRMQERASDSYVSELVTDVRKSLRKGMTMQEVVHEVIETAMLHMAAYGYNHFKYVLEIALVRSPIFMGQF